MSSISKFFPVGAVYIETTGVNPATTFGFGTWVAFAAGRTLIGNGTSDEDFTAGASGGESNHTLSVGEIPSHQHNIGGSAEYATGGTNTEALNNTNANYVDSQATGGGGPHNNLPPYLVVYIWHRTA